MRRAVSVLLFAFGGWMLTGELVSAFMDVEPGAADNALLIGVLGLIAGVPLLLGAWASPGRHWRELGLTILIAAGIATFCGVMILVLFMDPAFMRYMPPPPPDIDLAPAWGVLNLLVVALVGWLLYHDRRTDRP